MQRVSEADLDLLNDRNESRQSDGTGVSWFVSEAQKEAYDGILPRLIADYRDTRAALARAMVVVSAARAWRASIGPRFGPAEDQALSLLLDALSAFDKEPPDAPVARPKVVCLCGSTRFMDAFFDEGWRLTLEGCIVLSVGVVKTEDAAADGGHGAEMLGQDVVDRLDELHLRKIDLADEVLVLNVGGYIGFSTRREIEYAAALGKPVRYLEEPPDAA